MFHAMALATGLLFGSVTPAQALVPYVYVPPQPLLEGTALASMTLAIRLLRLGQTEEAARLAELTVQLQPDDARSWLLLAETQRQQNLAKAIDALQQAKRLDPANPDIWFTEGSLALRNGKPAEALQLLRRGLELDGRNSGAYFDLGNANLLLGDSRAALVAFQRASDLRGDFWEAINNQGLVLYEDGRIAEAIQRWRRVLKIKPDVAETSLALAAALYAQAGERRSEAFQLAERALAEDPNYVHDAFQKEQLWGPKLRAITTRLLQEPDLKAAVERATANADGPSQEGAEEEP